MRLYDWQTECLGAWAENGYRGIVNVATGAGKTVLALTAVRVLEEAVGDVQVKIIVPKVFLVRQWYYAIHEILGVPRKEIGIFAAARKSNTDRKFMIYVINSARYAFAKHMLADQRNPVLIIADECHHYGAEENSKIFDFARLVPNYGDYYTLGLSATPFSSNYEDVLAPYLGGEIYRFSFFQAIEAGIISQFSLFNIALDFSRGERNEYNELTDKLSFHLSKLKKHCPQLYVTNSRGFFAQLAHIAKTHGKPDIRQLAQTVSLLSYQRKELVHLAGARLRCVVDLVRRLGDKPKIILFGERIEMADMIYERLNALMPGRVGLYHSEMHESVRKVKLRNFEDSEISVLVSCKTLDEGLNVSDTDVGIVVSSTSAERQRIQRLGRVLRKKHGRESRARFYYLYVKDTMESAEVFGDVPIWLRDTLNVVDLDYDEKTGAFTNAQYDVLADIAVGDAESKQWDSEKIAELRRNIELGIISDDWLTDETACLKKINAAKTRREKNYYAAMLRLIRAKDNRSVNDDGD